MRSMFLQLWKDTKEKASKVFHIPPTCLTTRIRFLKQHYFHGTPQSVPLEGKWNKKRLVKALEFGSSFNNNNNDSSNGSFLELRLIKLKNKMTLALPEPMKVGPGTHLFEKSMELLSPCLRIAGSIGEWGPGLCECIESINGQVENEGEEGIPTFEAEETLETTLKC